VSGTTTGTSIVRAGSTVAIGMMAMNVMVYAFTLITAHSLAPEAFGGLGAMIALLTTSSVGALALQAAGARTIAVATVGDNAVAIASIRSVSRACADVPWTVALMLPVAVVPLTLMGGYAGVLQGQRSWGWLTTVFVALGLGRLGCGLVSLLVAHSLVAAMAGLTVGAFLPAVAGWWALRGADHHPNPPAAAALLNEIWHNAHALLAFFVLTNLDIIIARSVLSPHQSGIYAAGSILTKSCLFLPQFVIVLAFPTMATDHADDQNSTAWLKPLGLVAAIGAGVVLGAVLLRDITVAFVGGKDYADLTGYVWLYAVEGTLFALVQMAVYRQIARQHRRVPAYLWMASLAILGATQLGPLDSGRTLVIVVISITACAAVPIFLSRGVPHTREREGSGAGN
jgi:O-antigen/teichoic acid export membrane protein